MNCRSFHLFFC